MVTCLIPAYNEAERIGAVLDVVQKAKRHGLINSIMVVDDGSSDDTLAVARDRGADASISQPKNLGKSAAVVTGLKRIKRGDVLLLDADLTGLTIEHIRTLVTAGTNADGQMVVGFLSDDARQHVLPHLSGQRYLKRAFIDQIVRRRWDKGRNNFELLSNRLAAKLKSRTPMIPLPGLDHVRKEAKFTPAEATYRKFLFPVEMAKAYYSRVVLLVVVILMVSLAWIMLLPIRPAPLTLAAMPSLSPTDRVLVVAAHPDDEVIGAGGLIFNTRTHNIPVTVVVATLGDANVFSASVLEHTLRPDAADFIKEGNIRKRESETALSSLGVNDTIFLGFPDRHLKELLTTNWNTPVRSNYTDLSIADYAGVYKPNASYTGQELVSQLKAVIAAQNPTVIVTHLGFDTNADHQTIGAATQLAVADLTASHVLSPPKIYGFLVHWKISQFPDPFRHVPSYPLLPPKDLVHSCNWLAYPLSKATQMQKQSALQAYKSQLKSQFLKELIGATDRINELFCRIN